MTDDLIARAKAALEGVAEGPWEAPETLLGQRCTTVFGKGREHVLYHAGTDENARFVAAARTLVPELADALESSKESCGQWKALWRENTAQAAAAIEERDRANDEVEKLRTERREFTAKLGVAEVEKLRGAIETIRRLADTYNANAALLPEPHGPVTQAFKSAARSILAVIERNEKP